MYVYVNRVDKEVNVTLLLNYCDQKNERFTPQKSWQSVFASLI